MRGLGKKRMKRDGQTHTQTHGHRDSMIELAQWADSMKIMSSVVATVNLATLGKSYYMRNNKVLLCISSQEH